MINYQMRLFLKYYAKVINILYGSIKSPDIKNCQ